MTWCCSVLVSSHPHMQPIICCSHVCILQVAAVVTQPGKERKPQSDGTPRTPMPLPVQVLAEDWLKQEQILCPISASDVRGLLAFAPPCLHCMHAHSCTACCHDPNHCNTWTAIISICFSALTAPSCISNPIPVAGTGPQLLVPQLLTQYRP